MSASNLVADRDNCPDRNLLLAFSIGDLPQDVLDLIAVHLGRCEHCVTTP
jgi:hypothetical protein